MGIKKQIINIKNYHIDKLKKTGILLGILKAAVIVLLLMASFYICMHFMEYQKNSNDQVNKYRIDQVAVLSDGTTIEQVFKAKHSHLKTLKVYFSNDYAGAATGKVTVSIVDKDLGYTLAKCEKEISTLENFEYAEFNMNVQLLKNREYKIRVVAEGTESGKEPLMYQWSTKEKGFKGKMTVNGVEQNKYLVAKFYYPVTIYQKWALIAFWVLVIIYILLFGLPISKKIQNILGTGMLVIAPFLTFYMVEQFTNNDIFRMNTGLFALNILVYYMFFTLLYLVFVSRRLAVSIGMILWYAIGVGNYFVLNFRGTPIIPSDISSAATAANVASNYSYNIQPGFVWNALIILVYLTVLWNLEIKHKTGWKLRLILLLLVSVFSAVLGGLVIEQKTLKSVGVKNNVWDQKKGYAKNGLFFGFVLNLNSLVQEKPSDYSAEAAKSIAEKYAEKYANQSDDEKGALETKDGTKPNLICIMNEAFSDLSVIGDFNTNQDYMPFIHSLSDNTIKGSLYMSIFGSGTCNSEFEFLTGDTMAFLQSGIIAYTQIIKGKMPNITYTLLGQGYGGGVALHPYIASGWNRPVIYDLMGFKAFYSQDDITNPLMYRKYISDETDFLKIEDLYENREDKDSPFYMFNVTMQNHGGFDKFYSNFKHDVKITDIAYQSDQAEQYLSLIKKTDSAFEQLVDYFSKVDEPTIIVMFGDHEPAVESRFYNSVIGKTNSEMTPEEMQVKYQTPFIIWANYDIEEQTIDKMSANYLTAYVMDQAGLETTDYQKFLLELRENLPVITAMGCYDKDGNYYESALDSPYADQVKEYQILQYNNLIDIDHTVDSFFYLEEDEDNENN